MSVNFLEKLVSVATFVIDEESDSRLRNQHTFTIVKYFTISQEKER